MLEFGITRIYKIISVIISLKQKQKLAGVFQKMLKLARFFKKKNQTSLSFSKILEIV